MTILLRVLGRSFVQRIVIGFVIAGWAMGGVCSAEVVVAPAPRGEALCQDYTLKVDGKDVPIYACRVSAVPLNQVWPGYQRPIDQTELAGFAYWGMSEGPVRVEIESGADVQTVVVRPGSLKIKPTVKGHRIAFDMDRPRQVVVEVNGAHHALHLFGNPPETNVPAKDAPGVVYFGPGVHRADKITLENDQTLYLAPGAVVYGCVYAEGASNIRIAGRGILDMAPFERDRLGRFALDLRKCAGVNIDGIILRDPSAWGCVLTGCRGAVINNLKLVGLWRYNTDGIDICNSQDVKVADCFVRSFDDSLVVKGTMYRDLPVKNVRFSRCTLWCDWNIAMKIGTETYAPEISDVVFEDCDIIHTSNIALGITPRDFARIHDIRFENIRVDMTELNLKPQYQKRKGEVYSLQSVDYLPRLAEVTVTQRKPDRPVGSVAKVLFKNIAVMARRTPETRLYGFDAEHGVTDVKFVNITRNGKSETSTMAEMTVGKFVDGVNVTE